MNANIIEDQLQSLFEAYYRKTDGSGQYIMTNFRDAIARAMLSVGIPEDTVEVVSQINPMQLLADTRIISNFLANFDKNRVSEILNNLQDILDDYTLRQEGGSLARNLRFFVTNTPI
jgi:hypothetical protein